MVPENDTQLNISPPNPPLRDGGTRFWGEFLA